MSIDQTDPSRRESIAGGPSAELLEIMGAGFDSRMARDAGDGVAEGLLERCLQAVNLEDLAPADLRLLTLWVRDFQHGNAVGATDPSAWASLDYGAEDEARERLGLPDDEPVPFSAIPYQRPDPALYAAPTSAQADAAPTDLSGADFGAWVGL